MELKISKKTESELKRIRRDDESDEDLIKRMLKRYSLRRLPDETREEIRRLLEVPNRLTYKQICHMVTYKDAEGNTRHPTTGTISNIRREMKGEKVIW